MVAAMTCAEDAPMTRRNATAQPLVGFASFDTLPEAVRITWIGGGKELRAILHANGFEIVRKEQEDEKGHC